MTISDEDFAFWNDHSYLVVPRMFEADAENISAWVDEIAGWPLSDDKWLTFFEVDAPTTLSRVENFVPFHRSLGDVLNGPSALDYASDLMGERALLYKDRINFKPPGGGAHSAHQDGVAYEMGGHQEFDVTRPPYVSVLISVDAATVANGCLQVARNWRNDRVDILPMERPDPSRPNFSKISQRAEDDVDWAMVETQPGDAIFFSERLPHRSAANRSLVSRRILYGVYNPASEGDLRSRYFADKRLNVDDARYMVGNPHAPSTISAAREDG